MYRCVVLCFALISSSATLLAQAADVSHPHNSHAGSNAQRSVEGPSSQTSAAAESSILTVRYHCGNGNAPSDSCTINVTRSEFDALVQAIDPKMSANGRQSLASEYARLLIMAAEARRRGFDKSSATETLLKFSGLQVLAAQLVREINAHPPEISSADVERYFKEHQRDYQEVVLSRILVPSNGNSTAQNGTSAATRAAAIRARATSGEDFALLQREVNPSSEASLKVRMGPMPCQSLPESHRQVCDLEAGHISPVLADEAGYAIYRLESRRDWRLDEVREQIRAKLERERVQQEIHEARTPAALELDQSYFGTLPKPDVAEHHGMQMPAAKSTSRAEDTQHHH
ncbi:MAG TPA: hypothetical protein VF493_04020 [Terriglobales bacterium]